MAPINLDLPGSKLYSREWRSLLSPESCTE